MPLTDPNSVLQQIVAAFTNADFDRIPELVAHGLETGIPAEGLLDDGLIPGIREVGEQFRRGEVYLPEMMLAAESWQNGMDLIEPRLTVRPAAAGRGKVVIGTVRGDIHSLGKNIVSTLLKTAGFEIVDLGVDVAASTFVAEAAKHRADIIALCALMTTTMPQQQEVIEHLTAAGHRGDFYVMVGGASTSQQWADRIKADGYGATAADAVALAEAHMREARKGS